MEKILIVDDNEDLLFLLKTYLSNQYNVSTAKNGKEGIERFKREMPKVAVVDYLLPDMNGLNLATQLRKISNQVLLILFTAYADTIEEEMLKDKFDAVIRKPIKFESFLQIISTLLHSSTSN